MKKWYFVLIFAAILEAYQIPGHHVFPANQSMPAPWFTGPLIAPSALTIPAGHIDIEPYLYINANIGRYDTNWHRHKQPTLWSNLFQPLISPGITSWLDFSIYPGALYNYTDGAGDWHFPDMPFGFDIQLYKNNQVVTQWGTALALRIYETIPFGKYKNLKPEKLGTDIGGMGSWQTQAGIVWGNLFYIGGIHFITWRTYFQYTLPAPVHVKNLNVYGGGPGTRGTVYPAQNFEIDTAIEITLAQNWVFAMDLIGSWSGKTRFKGKSLFSNKAPPSAQFSMAPAIEYNFNASMGLIFGCWFTVAGRNTVQFVNSIIAFNYFH